MPEDIDWDEYNAAQWGRTPRESLTHALAVAGADGTGRVAVDLGCGEGVEVAALLNAGWTVHAVDGEAGPLRRLAERTAHPERLHTLHRPFADLDALPQADLIHSSYALPYCPPAHLDRVWAAVRGALRPGAVLAVQFFGPNDSMATDPAVSIHDADQVRAMLDGLEVVRWVEEDADGDSYCGPTHWHVFHVVARRPA